MWDRFAEGIVILSAISLAGAALPRPKLVTPDGIQSVNGSNVDMKCSGGGNCLFDDHVPHINTSLLNWASGLVTVMRNTANKHVTFDYVLLTFFFEASVQVRSIEIDLFLCPEWNIGAPFIGLYADNLSEFVYHDNDFIRVYTPPTGTCGCLSRIVVPVLDGEPPYSFWHILVTFPDSPSVQWVHVGEVTFQDTYFGSSTQPTTYTDCTFEPPPGTKSSEYFILASSSVPVNSLSWSSSPIPTRIVSTSLPTAGPSSTTVYSLPQHSSSHTKLLPMSVHTPVSSSAVLSSPELVSSELTSLIHSTLSPSILEPTSLPLVPTHIPIHTASFTSAANSASSPYAPDTTALQKKSSTLSPLVASSTIHLNSAPITFHMPTTVASSILFTSLIPPYPMLTTARLSPSVSSSLASVSTSISTTVLTSVTPLSTAPPDTSVLNISTPTRTPLITASVFAKTSDSQPLPSFTASPLKSNSDPTTVLTGDSPPVSVVPTSSTTSAHTEALESSLLHNGSGKLYTAGFTSVPPTLFPTYTVTSPQSVSAGTSIPSFSTVPPSLPVSASRSVTETIPSSTNNFVSVVSTASLTPHASSSANTAQRSLPKSALFPGAIPPTNTPSATRDGMNEVYGIGPEESIDLDVIGGLAATKDRHSGFPLVILIVLLVMIGLCSLVLAMLMLLGVYFRRRQSTRMKTIRLRGGHELSVFNPLYVCPSILTEGVYQDCIQPSDFTDEHGLGISPSKSSPFLQVAPLFLAPNNFPGSCQSLVDITRDNLSEVEVLASGLFGEVALAYTSGLCLTKRQLCRVGNGDQESPMLVAVKKLQPNPSETQREAFDKEAQFMSQIKHPNVLRLLGVCHHDPAFIMMEFTEQGDLNQFLQKYSDIVAATGPCSNTQIATSTVLYMASQVATAMQYLAAFDFIHRDIATRKCVVGKNFLVKLADLGVNMSSYQSHYYCIRGNRLLPIRWLATESFEGKFSEKSDVWAFGVTMWELFTLAKDLPYPHLSDEEVIHNALQTEHFQPPGKPKACPQSVYQIMQQCWAINLQQRATFQEVNEMFKTCI